MARQIGERFSMQHDKQLGATVWDIVRRNWDLWSMHAGPEVKKRGASFGDGQNSRQSLAADNTTTYAILGEYTFFLMIAR